MSEIQDDEFMRRMAALFPSEMSELAARFSSDMGSGPVMPETPSAAVVAACRERGAPDPWRYWNIFRAALMQEQS